MIKKDAAKEPPSSPSPQKIAEMVSRSAVSTQRIVENYTAAIEAKSKQS